MDEWTDGQKKNESPTDEWGAEPHLAVDSCGILLGDIGQRCA